MSEGACLPQTRDAAKEASEHTAMICSAPPCCALIHTHSLVTLLTEDVTWSVVVHLVTGTAGVELLTNCMNNYFTRVINMILAFDGDVVKFAGDSMIVVFAPTPLEARAEDQGLKAATSRCAQCAHVLAKKLGHMRMKMNGQVRMVCCFEYMGCL